MKLSLQFQEDVFHPCDEESYKFMQSLAQNQEVIAEVKISRSPRFHRRAMAIFRELHAMTDDEGRIGFEPWRRMMTIKAGYFTSIGKVDVNGQTSVAVVPDSLSFENMEDDQFRKVFNDILNAFGQKYGHQLTLEQLTTWSRY